MSGVKLDGNKLVRYAYIDESGISINEKCLIVAGVVVDADSQWKRVADHLDSLVAEFVPQEHREGFIFHATKLFHRSGPIPAERSHEALSALLKVPATFKLPIVFGFINKALVPIPELPNDAPQRLKRKAASLEAGINHSIAFSLCAIAVETFMKDDAPPDEVATLIVENNTDTQKHVKTAYKAMKGKNLTTETERLTFAFLSERHPDVMPLQRIIDVPHMVQKHEASLLQIADACAMMIRYSLEERRDAESFLNTLCLGLPDKIHDSGRFKNPDVPAGFNVLTFSKPRNLPDMYD